MPACARRCLTMMFAFGCAAQLVLLVAPDLPERLLARASSDLLPAIHSLAASLPDLLTSLVA